MNGSKGTPLRTVTVSRLLLFVVLALGVALRLGHLFLPLQDDEAVALQRYAPQPLLTSWMVYDNRGNHILNTLLMHVSLDAFGDAPWAGRLPAFVAGVLLLPAAAALGRILGGRLAGVLAAGLVGTCTVLVDYATNARGYSPQALLLTVALLALAQAGRTGRWQPLLVAALMTALAALTLPTTVYACGVLGLWLAGLLVARRADLGGWWPVIWRLALFAVATGLLTLLLYAPTLVGAWQNPQGAWFLAADKSGEAEALDALTGASTSTWSNWNGSFPPLVWPLLVLAALGGALHRPRLSHRASLLALALVGGLVPLVLGAGFRPPSRTLTWALPIVLALSAHGLLVGLYAVSHRLRARRAWQASALAAGLPVLIGGWWIGWQPLSRFHAFGAEMQAVAPGVVAQVLPDARTRVVVSNGAIGLPGYYLQKAGLTADRFIWNGDMWRSAPVGDAAHLYVITDEVRTNAYGKSALVKGAGLTLSDWTEPRLVEEHPDAAIWRLDLKDPAKRATPFPERSESKEDRQREG